MTTDACNTGHGATLWQREGEIFRPIAFASRFLTDCERKYAANELELLGALWGLEYFRYYVYGKKVNLLTDHQAQQPPITSPIEIHKTTKCFVGVNKNPIKFKGEEAMVEVKTEKSKEVLPMLNTENKTTQPLMGLDWLDKLEIGLQGNKNTNIIRHIETDGRRQKIMNEYEDLFKNNHTIKDLTIDIQLKKDTKPIQQKGRPVPIHFQKTVKHELQKLIEKGHLEKADKTTENCFISPAVITIKRTNP